MAMNVPLSTRSVGVHRATARAGGGVTRTHPPDTGARQADGRRDGVLAQDTALREKGRQEGHAPQHRGEG